MKKEKKPKKSFSINRLIDKLAHILAFLALFTLSTYGLRELLGTVNETISYVITVSAIALIAYVLFIRTSDANS